MSSVLLEHMPCSNNRQPPSPATSGASPARAGLGAGRLGGGLTGYSIESHRTWRRTNPGCWVAQTRAGKSEGKPSSRVALGVPSRSRTSPAPRGCRRSSSKASPHWRWAPRRGRVGPRLAPVNALPRLASRARGALREARPKSSKLPVAPRARR